MPLTVSPVRLVKTGFWLGLGFSLPLIAAQLAANGFEHAIFHVTLKEKMQEAIRGAATATGSALVDNVRVISHSQSREEDVAIFRGSVENVGEETFGAFTLEVEFFDDQKRFLTECQEIMSVRLKPKQHENFEFRCRNISADVQYSSTQLRVVSVSMF
jgi:hypothetical protein